MTAAQKTKRAAGVRPSPNLGSSDGDLSALQESHMIRTRVEIMAKQRWLNCWIANRLEMLISPAWQHVPRPLRRMLERLEIEHLRHGGLKTAISTFRSRSLCRAVSSSRHCNSPSARPSKQQCAIRRARTAQEGEGKVPMIPSVARIMKELGIVSEHTAITDEMLMVNETLA